MGLGCGVRLVDLLCRSGSLVVFRRRFRSSGLRGEAVGRFESLAARACEYGVLGPIENWRRGVFYQADELVDLLEGASSAEGVRRMLATGRSR